MRQDATITLAKASPLRKGLFFLLMTALLLSACQSAAPTGPSSTPSPEPIEMRVLMAGSLIVPFDEIESAFEAQYPHVDLLMEGHGSIQCVRIVSELHELADVIVTADHALIPLLMYETENPDTGEPYADWYAAFATNKLTLAYTDQSARADEITAQNWYAVVNEPDVRLGVPDPRFDAAGYRGLMAFQLAELHYDSPIIFDNFTMGRFRYPFKTTQDADSGRWIIHVPEIVEPKPDSGLIVRGGSIQLIALLESGDVDYAFEYESVSQQHNFRYVSLPDTVNLGNEAMAPLYDSVEVQLDFQRFTSVEPHFPGEPIGYGVTIPSSAPHPEMAAEFVAFLLGAEGKAILEANHHPTLETCRGYDLTNAPAPVQELCVAE